MAQNTIKIIWRGEEVVKKVRAAAEKRMDILANEMKEDIQRSMLLPKHGKPPRKVKR